MNKKLIILLLIILSFSLTGCYGNLYNRFETLEDDPSGYRIAVDKETGVQYLFIYHGATVLLDKDGKPLLHEGGPK